MFNDPEDMLGSASRQRVIKSGRDIKNHDRRDENAVGCQINPVAGASRLPKQKWQTDQSNQKAHAMTHAVGNLFTQRLMTMAGFGIPNDKCRIACQLKSNRLNGLVKEAGAPKECFLFRIREQRVKRRK